ncbi:MAG: hypothetical protein H3C69_09200 [Candidatus Promineofilum sp.]|nr:hypothetical protein [Promineifilum sp.]
MLTDNLLDLTHAAYLHPALIASDSTDRTRVSIEQEGDELIYRMCVDDEPVNSTLFKLFWDREEETAFFWNNLHWMAPSHIIHNVGMTPKGVRSEDAPAAPTAHLITPATDSATHYFWASARNRRVEDDDITHQMHAMIAHAFDNEDGPMIKQAFGNMGGQEFWALRPVILAGDAAGVRARRILQKLIRAEFRATDAEDIEESDFGNPRPLSVGAV